MKDKVRITADDLLNEGLMRYKDSLTANDAKYDAWMIYGFKDNANISKKQLYNSVKGYISKPEDGVTIVFFEDGQKEIAKVQDGGTYDLYVGIMVCILKHVGHGFGDSEIEKIINRKHIYTKDKKQNKPKKEEPKKDEPLKYGVIAYITATDSELKDVGVSDFHQYNVVTIENYRVENGVLIYIVRKDKDKYTWEVPSTFVRPFKFQRDEEVVAKSPIGMAGMEKGDKAIIKGACFSHDINIEMYYIHPSRDTVTDLNWQVPSNSLDKISE